MPPAKSFERSAREIELSEQKLELECTKIGLEIERGRAMVSEAVRDERNAMSKASEARVYNFVESVGASSVKSCVTILEEWARRGTDEITIVFNSPGGQVFHGLALYDAIKAIQAKGIVVNTVTRGMAASMGGVLFQAGHERVIGKNAYILIHEVQDVAAGTTADLEDELEFTKRVQQRLLGILAERSTMTAKQIERKWKKTDWWIDADEAVELGFADRIG